MEDVHLTRNREITFADFQFVNQDPVCHNILHFLIMFRKSFLSYYQLFAVHLLVLSYFCGAIVGYLRQPLEFQKIRTADTHRLGKQLGDPTVYRCGQIGKDLVVNFVNAKYPDDDKNGGDCRFRLVISGPHVCQVRVDFVDSDMNTPTRGDCLSQTLEVEGPVWPTGLPPLCGVNTDQHFYLHLEPWGANTSWVDFRVSTVVSGKPYRFGLWLTQIDCTTFNVLKAPEGCTQFFIGERGVVKSFNYEGMSSLNGQDYRVCIRPDSGVCGIRYNAGPEEFRVRKSVMTSKEIQLKSGTGSNICALDYVLIPGGRDSFSSVNTRKSRLLFLRRPVRPNLIIVNNPSATTVAPGVRNGTENNETVAINKRTNNVELKPQWDRYCGGALAAQGGETVGKPVVARVRSNLISFTVRTAATTEKKNARRNFFPNMRTGFRISFTQIKECEDKETDLASPPTITELVQAMNPDSNKDFLLSIYKDSSEAAAAIKKTSQADASVEAQNDNTTDVKSESIWDYLDDHEEDEAEELHEDDEDDLYDF